jgi:Ca2+/Na+ antiporter
MYGIIIKEFLIALIIATILSVTFALTTRSRGDRRGFTWFFLIILMATWAGGIWLQPFGPAFGEIRWMPFLAIGLTFAVFITLFGSRRPPHGRHETLDKLEEIAQGRKLEKVTYVTLSTFFWVVLFTLLVVVFIRYVMRY